LRVQGRLCHSLHPESKKMERKAFSRTNDIEIDDMGPLSDSDCGVQEFAAQKKAMASLARRRGSYGRQSFEEPSRTKRNQLKPPATSRNAGRELWADIATDDEDNFPRWHGPKAQAAKVVPSPVPAADNAEDGDGLCWDPIGMGTTESSISELLWNKVNVKPSEISGNPKGFDKWSWSTTATSADGELQDEDASPSAQSQAPVSIISSEDSASLQTGLFLATSTDESDKQRVSSAPAMMQEASQRVAPTFVMPMPSQAAQATMVAVPAVQAVQAMPAVQAVQVQAMPAFAAVPFPFGMGMGMLPAVMTMTQHVPRQVESQQTRGKEEEIARPIALRSGLGLEGPPMGTSHRFHQKNNTMGVLSEDARTFTKRSNKGRLSIVCENKVHFQGTVRYAVQFTDGELCSADGVGFIISSDLPCTKNIQKIVSVFANRTGRICIRVHDEVERCPQRVKCLEVGDWLEVCSDLTQQTVSFTVWPKDGSEPSFATVSFKETLAQARARGVNGLPRSVCGYLAVVIKHLGVSVALGS